MTLCVCDRLLAVAPVCKNPANVGHVPLLVRLLLEDLDPHVRDSHSKPVVEADATKREWEAKSGHARYIFRDSDAFGVEPVEHLVGEHQVRDTLLVNLGTEVLVVSSRETPGAIVSFGRRVLFACSRFDPCTGPGGTYVPIPW